MNDPAHLTPDARERLVRLAYRFLWNREDAEDVVQDALAVCHAREQQLRAPQRWWSWLCRVVVHGCHEHGRRKKRRRRLLSSLPVGEAAQPPPSSSDRSAFNEALRAAIQSLPPRQKEVIVLRHLQEMSFDEIAEVLNIAPATARVHAQAGREAIRKYLVSRHRDWFDERH